MLGAWCLVSDMIFNVLVDVDKLSSLEDGGGLKKYFVGEGKGLEELSEVFQRDGAQQFNFGMYEG